MKALVTGAGGFLGTALVQELLAHGRQVRALGRGRYPHLEKLPVELARVDLRDRDATVAACAGVDEVHHVASIAGIWGRWSTFYDINVRGTQHLLEGCRRHGVPRLVYTSSPSVTYAGGDQCGVDETAPYPTRWLCHYAHTKALAEQAVLAANQPGGLLTCALRPHLIWGPRDQHLVPRLLARARAGQLRIVGNGKNLIDMIYVENAALAQRLAADRLVPGSPVAGSAYFLSQGEPVNCWGWINQVLALAQLPPVERRVPLGLARMAGAVFEALWTVLGREDEPRMTRFLAGQLGTSHYFDIGRARRELDYAPRVSTAEGMRRLAAWLRETSIVPA